jgi:hypothetical protein
MASQFTKRLDKSRSYGEHHPPENGAFYQQDGYNFDHEGYLVDDLLTDAQKERLKKLPPPKSGGGKPPKPAKQQAAPPSEGGEGGGGEPGGEGEGGDNADLNLTLWLKGEAEYDFADVQKAVKTRYHAWKTSKRDLVNFLVTDEKLVPYDEVAEEFREMID